MTDLLTQLEAAQAEVARLKGEIAQGPCKEYGHTWQHIGGANCGCIGGQCSVPVYQCSKCSDCDYGDNPEANDKRARCEDAL